MRNYDPVMASLDRHLAREEAAERLYEAASEDEARVAEWEAETGEAIDWNDRHAVESYLDWYESLFEPDYEDYGY